jgi:hypothetical protein
LCFAFRFGLGYTLFQIGTRIVVQFELLCCRLFSSCVQIVASSCSVLSFLLVVRLGYLLIVRLAHLWWNALHAKDLKINIVAILEHIWHRLQLFLVNLLHVDSQAANRV